MRRIKIFTPLIISILLLFSGCSKTETVPNVVVDSEDNTISYSLVSASIEDVVLTQRVDCTSVQTKDQEVSFSVTGKYVDKVYVREGETVKKGDLLCELSSASLEEEIEDLTYKIKRNELRLSYLDMDQSLELQDLFLIGIFGEEETQAVRDRYARQRTLINDDLEFDREELAAKQAELRNSRLYATMDGTVYKLDKKLRGSTSKEGKVIMTIIDMSEILFVVKDTEYKDLFHEGDMVDMTVSYSAAAGDYIVTPYQMDTWEDTMVFSVYTGPDNKTVEVGTYGTLYPVVDTRKNVLSLPKEVVHEAGDKAFVYTLSEDNIREIRYVEIGLFGDERVEILSGLEEGEKVVKK